VVPASFYLPVLATLIAVASAFAGIALLDHVRHTRMLIPLSGGLLVGVALFGLAPELVADMGWARGIALVVAGYLVLH